MNRYRVLSAMLAGAVLITASPACEPPGVGDPCTPEVRPPPDPERPGLNQPWAYGEVSVETRSLQCKTRTCMVYHFFPAGRDTTEPDWRVCPNPTADLDGSRVPCEPGCGEVGGPVCATNCCNWPDEGAASEPCRAITTENFVKNFCRWTRTGDIWGPDYSIPYGHDGWYCNFDMSLINLAQPFCTLKCGGAGRTFECPENFVCREVVRMGPEGMRGSYCVPSRLADCDPRTPNNPSEQDCCQLRSTS